METSLHIGAMLSAHFKKHRIYKSALARVLGKKDSDLLRYQKKESLQLRIVEALSHALKHNFFMDIAVQLPKEYATEQDIYAEKDQHIAQLEQQILQLTTERNILLKALGK